MIPDDTQTTLMTPKCSARIHNSMRHRIGNLITDSMANRAPRMYVRVRAVAVARPSISADMALALMTPPDRLDARQRAFLVFANKRIAEPVHADALFIASPVHNDPVAVVLKTWIDHVVRAGAIFRTTSRVKIGVLRDRLTVVAVTAGGGIFGDSLHQPDFSRPCVALKTMGISDVYFASSDRTAGCVDPLGDGATLALKRVETGVGRLQRSAA